MLSVSTTATWSRPAVIHARYFWAFAAHVFFVAFVRRVHHKVTPVVRLRVACLLHFDGRRIRTRRHKGRPTAFSRCATGSVPSGTGGKRSNTTRSIGMRGINGAADLPLGGSSFGPHTVPGRHPWCNLLTWCSEQKSQPLSRQCFTRDTWHRTSRLFVAQAANQVRCLGRHHARAWPRGDPVSGAVQVEGHVLGREPASRAQWSPLVRPLSRPPSAYFSIFCQEGRNAEVAQLTEDDSEQGTRRRL